MDDGARSRSAVYLNTQQFSLEEQEFLCELLQKTFGIHSALNRDKKYYRLRVSTESTRRFVKIVEEYVLPCFRYKLGHDPVTTDPKGDGLRNRRPRRRPLSHLNQAMLARATVGDRVKI